MISRKISRLGWDGLAGWPGLAGLLENPENLRKTEKTVQKLRKPVQKQQKIRKQWILLKLSHFSFKNSNFAREVQTNRNET